MMTFNRSAVMGATAVALALFGTTAIASLPVVNGLVIACLMVAGVAYVAFAAQSGRFDDERRLVYRPVYVRSRNVHRRVSSFDD